MTEREFRHVVRSDSRADEAFNYIFVIVFLLLGVYWLAKLDLRSAVDDVNVLKLVLRIAAIILPIVFSVTILRGISLNNKVTTIRSGAVLDDKMDVLSRYLSGKTDCTEIKVTDGRVQAYEYYTKFGIPVYLYVHIHDDFVLFCIRRKDNFSLKELFDAGTVNKSQKALKKYLESELVKNNTE